MGETKKLKLKEYESISKFVRRSYPTGCGRKTRFGDGEIVSMEGEGGDAKVTVAFKNFGERRLLLKFAKLSVLG